ncbi:MAG: hypothetical protein AAGA96_15735 [Verrucomicrobiota bacterium]
MREVSEQSSFSREARAPDEGRYASGNLILWIAAIAVLIGLNFASWSFCMWVFGQPEHPMNYRLLKRLDKLDPIEGFTRVSAPRGKFYSSKDLYAEIYAFNAAELGAYNGILKRSYLKNYKGADDIVFLSGEFEVLSVQEMGEADVFQTGIVIRGLSTDFPDAQIDFALPAEEMPGTFNLSPGEVFRVTESTTCAALLNVQRLPNDTMIFSVVPLVTKTFATPPGPKPYEFKENAVILVSTPEQIQLDPSYWPISEEQVQIEEKPVGLSVESEEKPEPDGISGETDGTVKE